MTRRGFLRRGPGPLRPPGARPGEAFSARCIRCGRCVAACPYRALRPASLAYGLDAGTPCVVPREAPCLLCMACPPARPTGALDAALRDPRAARMGRARVAERTCYAFQGVLCRTCVDECPLGEEAIRQDAALRPVVTERCACPGAPPCHARCRRGVDPRSAGRLDGCTSCLACVEVCPTGALRTTFAPLRRSPQEADRRPPRRGGSIPGGHTAASHQPTPLCTQPFNQEETCR